MVNVDCSATQTQDMQFHLSATAHWPHQFHLETVHPFLIGHPRKLPLPSPHQTDIKMSYCISPTLSSERDVSPPLFLSSQSDSTPAKAAAARGEHRVR